MKVPTYERVTVFVLAIVALVEKSSCSSKYVPSRNSSSVPNIYNVLALMYRLCAVEESDRVSTLDCLDKSMTMQVSKGMERCFRKNADENDDSDARENKPEDEETQSDGVISSLDYTCSHFTKVNQWVSKHSKPPDSLTRVISLAAFGRLFCVLGTVQRPIRIWETAFSKCLPENPVPKEELKSSSNNK